ncbi:MAG: DUF3054 domain-containing protein [Anaerolineae bacterium]
MKRTLLIVLLAGDLIALLAFVLIGQADHQTLNAANPIAGALPNAVAFIVPWVVAGWLLGAYPAGPALPALGSFMGRSLNTWLVAAPLGVLLRAALLGRSVIPTPFLAVTLAVGGLFILGWRLLFRLVLARQAGTAEPANKPS